MLSPRSTDVGKLIDYLVQQGGEAVVTSEQVSFVVLNLDVIHIPPTITPDFLERMAHNLGIDLAELRAALR